MDSLPEEDKMAGAIWQKPPLALLPFLHPKTPFSHVPTPFVMTPPSTLTPPTPKLGPPLLPLPLVISARPRALPLEVVVGPCLVATHFLLPVPTLGLPVPTVSCRKGRGLRTGTRNWTPFLRPLRFFIKGPGEGE